MRNLASHLAVALIAASFAVGGTALATSSYIVSKESQVKPSVLKALKGNVGAVGQRGEQGYMGPQGLSGRIGERGSTGGEGPEGRRGERGPAGVQLGALHDVDRFASVPAKTEGTDEVICPEGARLVSGGGSGNGLPLLIDEANPNENGGWEIEVDNTSAVAVTVFVNATCIGP